MEEEWRTNDWAKREFGMLLVGMSETNAWRSWSHFASVPEEARKIPHAQVRKKLAFALLNSGKAQGAPQEITVEDGTVAAFKLSALLKHELVMVYGSMTSQGKCRHCGKHAQWVRACCSDDTAVLNKQKVRKSTAMPVHRKKRSFYLCVFDEHRSKVLPRA